VIVALECRSATANLGCEETRVAEPRYGFAFAGAELEVGSVVFADLGAEILCPVSTEKSM
jgi:hypothetical protein